MKLVNPQASKPVLNKKYLIPSILAMGLVPLIMHEHTYRTHLEDEDWFAVGNYTATDFFLFWKQWTVIILALVCLLILLIRAKYYYEELPWDKKAFIPLVIYCAFVFLSACFAKKPIFAWAGGYDMFQSALAILSYAVLFYYTYSCIKSMDHVLYLLRGSEYFILAEVVICFFQALGLDPISTTVGKIMVTSPSRWSNLSSLTLSPTVYGTMYNIDYLAMYLPVLFPIVVTLIIVEDDRKRKIFNSVLAVLMLIVMARASLSGILALIGAVVIGLFILGSRKKKYELIFTVCVAAVIVCGLTAVYRIAPLRARVSEEISPARYINDWDVPISNIVTGDGKEGVEVDLKDGRQIKFTFTIDKNNTLQLDVKDGSGNPLEMYLADQNSQTYGFTEPAYSKDMYFYMDTSRVIPDLAFVKDFKTFFFTKGDKGYYLISTAGRNEKLPQKNRGEVYEIFKNGFLNGRGPIYNRTLPLLKKYIFVGAGADNYIMAYPQRDYIYDYYINGGVNQLNVKPHSFYLQVWVQEGFIAFAAILAFLFWYLIRSAKLYRKVEKKDKLGMTGFAVLIGVVAYMIAVLANDSTICTAPVFWCILGLGFGINELKNKENKDAGR